MRSRRVARNLIRMFFRERVETALGTLDHTSKTAGQYALIKYNPNEHVMDKLHSELFKRYTQHRVYHYTGLSWDRFYHQTEYWETEALIEECMELAAEEHKLATQLQNEAQNALNGGKK